MAKAEARAVAPETPQTADGHPLPVDGPRCLVCHEVVAYDDHKEDSGFNCPKQPGKHTLDSKTYYSLGARHVQNPRDRRLFAPLIVLRPAYELRDPITGRITMTKALHVQFIQGGTYTTSDAEEQYYLDRKQGLLQGDEGLRAWQKVYLTPEQQVKLAKDEVAELESRARQLREGNALLDQVKRAKQAGAGAGPSA